MKGRPASLKAAWPWRGLAWAALLAVFAHLAALTLTQSDFTFSFQRPDSATSLNTRMIEPVPTPAPPTAPAPQRSDAPARSDALAAQPSASLFQEKKQPPALSPPLLPDSPAEPIKKEENMPKVSAESAQSATETVALATLTTPTLPSDAAASAAPASGTFAPPGVKLSYPANAVLQLDGTFMRRGSAQTGSGLLSWSTDGTNYVLSLEATALVVLSQTESSVGALSQQGLQPQTYSSKRTGRSEQATHFRPEIGKIQFSNNKPDAVLMVGAQDRLSALVQLAGIIGGDPERFKIVNRIQMQVAGLDNAEIWEFNVEGISDVSVPAANMQALKLSRTPRNEFDQRLEIWLAPQLGYLPVRIRQSSNTTPDQDFTDLKLRVLPGQRPLLPAV